MNELRIVISLSPETSAAIAACIGAVASAESDAPISAATAPASMNGTAAPASMNGTAAPAKRGPGRPRKNPVEGPAAPPAAPAAAPAVPVDFLSAPAAPSAAPDDFLSAPAAAPAAALDDFLSAPAAKPVTDDELQAALRAEVSRLGSSTSVIALLKSAKVAKATDIPAAQRPAFLAAVRALTA